MENQKKQFIDLTSALAAHMFFAQTNEPVKVVYLNYNYGQFELVIRGNMWLDMRTTQKTLPKVGFSYPNENLQYRLGQITVTAEPKRGEFLIAIKKMDAVIKMVPAEEATKKPQSESQKKEAPAQNKQATNEHTEGAGPPGPETPKAPQEWFLLAKSDPNSVLGIKLFEPEIKFDLAGLALLSQLLAGYHVVIREMALIEMPKR